MIKSKRQFNIQDLSTHLFWEYDIGEIDIEKHKALIILRVLEYGVGKDWELIKKGYSVAEIKEVATNARSLDEVALHFIAFYTNTSITAFKCYKLRQSTPNYSGY